MSNTSATGGPLVPEASPAPLMDATLEDFLQVYFQAMTGMTGANFRPRVQQEMPNLPDAAVNWVAFGLVLLDPDWGIYEGDPNDVTSVQPIQHHETLEILLSFYGPNAQREASQLNTGLRISQNVAPLTAVSMGLLNTDGPRRGPELIKHRWLNRWDLTVRLRRLVLRNYPVLSLQALDVGIKLEGARHVLESTVTTTPPP